MSLELILHKLLEQELKKLLIMPLYKISFAMLPSIFLLFYTFLRAKSFMSKKEDNLHLTEIIFFTLELRTFVSPQSYLLSFFTFFPFPVIIMYYEFPLKFLTFDYI